MLTEDDKSAVKTAIEKLRTTVNGGDTDAIKADTEALEKEFYKLSEKVYQQSAPQGDAQNGNAGGSYEGGANGEGGTYYDANFEDNNKGNAN